MTFCVEGQENEIWDEYITGTHAKGVMAHSTAVKRRVHRGAKNTIMKTNATLR